MGQVTMEKKKILIVDDQEVNRFILGQIFQKDYTILEASNGIEALKLIRENLKNLSVILLDYIMPDMDGFSVLKEMNAKKYLRFVPVIMITTDQSVEIESKGFSEGVSDFITKPFQPSIVLKRTQNVIDLYEHKNSLEKLVSLQTLKIRKQSEKMRALNSNIIETLSSVVEFRDLESGEHIKRVKDLSGILGTEIMKEFPEYNLTTEKIELIRSAAPLHDIGKVAIPDRILLKPAKLTDDEFDVMKSHTIKGCEIIERFDFIDDKEFYQYCYDICRYHHEKYDGQGYPEGLKGDDIPIAAQIVALADVFDALVSERIYKEKYPPQKSIQMILDGECGLFNPKLLKCFIKVKDDFVKAEKL